MGAFDTTAAVVRHLDFWWAFYRDRLDGLTDEEHLWSPVEGWTVRETPSGWVIDPVDRSADPAPFTSIAWRMWHIAVDVLDSYSLRAFGVQAGPDDMTWVGTADEALARTDASWRIFRDGVAALSAEELGTPIGEQFGWAADRSHLELAMFGQSEMTHHGAEIALLRDLYRHRS